MTAERNPITIFFKISETTKTVKTILETVQQELFLQKDLIILLEIFLNEWFLKKVMLLELMYYLQNKTI